MNPSSLKIPRKRKENEKIPCFFTSPRRIISANAIENTRKNKEEESELWINY
jgi:hypothetical protein